MSNLSITAETTKIYKVRTYLFDILNKLLTDEKI